MSNNKDSHIEDLNNDLKGRVVVFSTDGDIELIRHNHPAEAEATLVERINVSKRTGLCYFNPWGWRVDNAGKLYIP